ncbi:peptidoglycan-recognition protein 2-like [Macrosteles quadrilineatus]|uniref:peptidoglycan-recognition protein 2-like n=1 Tax=Macrosteles quadrilineatus TaxID=74068 RepID=UPI0023E2953E|nr:peptidoglycan-recognition protein 2-like [Macrosteles quadrilineatus]
MNTKVFKNVLRTPPIEKFEYVSRKEWGARQPLREVEKLNYKFPLPFVVLTYTNTPPCTSVEQCKRSLRKIQTLNMYEDDLPDIKYNWLVGNDGHIYEGLGWDFAATWNDPRHDRYRLNSVTFAFMDDMSGEVPNPNAMVALRFLAVEGAKKNFIKHPITYVRMFAKEDEDMGQELLK